MLRETVKLQMNKKRLVTLMTVALLTSLCACNQETTPSQTPGNAPPPDPADASAPGP
jgi:hypothetical protein